MASIKLPTDKQKQAFVMREKMGLNDSQIAAALGIKRVAVNRRIARFRRCVGQLQAFCGASGNCGLAEALMA